MSSSYISPKLMARRIPEKGFLGVVTCEPIVADELLMLWGGLVLDVAGFAALSEDDQTHGLQIEEGLYLVATAREDSDYVNHSCDPNAWLEGQVALRARRAIAAGEEICFDYAMTDGSDYDEFECVCGTGLCRGKVTSQDWQLRELQERYGGHFSPYLLRRIVAQRA